MAYKGKIIKNKRTKQSIQFVTTSQESNGEMLEMISTWQSFSRAPEPHYHPSQHEYFTVMQGELTVKLADQRFLLKKGDSLDIPRNTAHSMWNNSKDIAVASWKVVPALQTEYLLETATGLANDRKTGKHKISSFLQSILLAQHYRNVYRLTKPSCILQRIIFTLIAPFALLLGKKAVYKEYID